MRGQLLVAGLVVVLLGADEPKGDPAKEEAAKLEGTWTVVSQSEERTIPESYKIQKVVIKGIRLTLVTKDLSVESEFTVDPTKDPTHLDCTIAEGRRKGTVLPGIYQLDGDELKYCYNTGAGPGFIAPPAEGIQGRSQQDRHVPVGPEARKALKVLESDDPAAAGDPPRTRKGTGKSSVYDSQ